MPGEMQGPDLLREIRKRRPDAPAILMSGYTREDIQQAPGTDECLAKPVTMSELARAIRRVLKAR